MAAGIAWHYARMPTTHTDHRHTDVLNAEDAYTDFLRDAHGPMWGEDDEDHAERLARRVRAAYAAHNVPADDRIVGI